MKAKERKIQEAAQELEGQIKLAKRALRRVTKKSEAHFKAKYEAEKKAGLTIDQRLGGRDDKGLEIIREENVVKALLKRLQKKQIMKFANHKGWTDVEPWEVVKVISPICVEIRSMTSELDKDWKPEMHVGGFSAHTSNNYSQKWNTVSNPEGGVQRIRWSEAKKEWRGVGGATYQMDSKPHKFYDYNF